MAGQLADSMKADAPREDDIPERPVFTNISNYDFDDEDEDLQMVAEPKSTYGSKRTPIAQSAKPAIGGTYKPSYVPPTPAAPVRKKPVIEVDTSGVKAGTLVKHKAFGVGEVVGIDGGSLVVSFKGEKKTFQFPGAFDQGFLALDV